MDIEDFKKMWNKAEIRPEMTEPQIFAPMARGRIRTSLDTLADTYRRFAILGLLITQFPWVLLRLGDGGVIQFTWALPLLWEAVGIISMSVDFTLSRKVRDIDVSTMSVTEVVERARMCRKIHLLSQAVLLPLVIAVICVLGHSIRESFFLYGIIAGATIGIAIGIKQWVRIMKIYRSVIDDSHDLLSEK